MGLQGPIPLYPALDASNDIDIYRHYADEMSYE